MTVVGQNIERSIFSQHDYKLFQNKLFEQLEQLKFNIYRPNFGIEELKIGAELELYLIDKDGEPKLNNEFLLNKIKDKQFQPELNQYNLELNLSAFSQEGKPLSKLHGEMNEKTDKLQTLAKQYETDILPIGILPTLRKRHLNTECMTNLPRYNCLADHLYQQRGENFQININGKDPLIVDFSNICAEGANTSLQIHLMAKPEQLVNTYNAAQLTMSLVTAISANSPIFLGNTLWHETRIALFKQSLDVRHTGQYQWQQPTRVSFGHGWLRNNIWEFFAQTVSLYSPLIPYINEDAPTNDLLLNELCLHLGTIWPWIRPVYSAENNGHIRLEFRAISAGPTSIDMIANAAFAIGLAIGLQDDIEELIAYIPFKFAEYNFYRAAQFGLNAKILWPSQNKYRPQEVDIKQIIAKLLPTALKGLISLNINAKEAQYYLNIIEQRLAKQFTGALWQIETLTNLKQKMDKNKACQQLVQCYLNNSRSCEPVVSWE
jgi:gamma-glutamyl:cysteine ligase YbdK (ATP-grasp superfamily)